MTRCLSCLSLPRGPLPTPGLRLPVVPEGKIRQRLQNPLVGAAADPRDGRGERAQDPHGRAPPGEHRVAAKHAHAPGPQHRGQLHRRRPSQQEKGFLQDLQPRSFGVLSPQNPAGDPGHPAGLEQQPRGHQRVPGGAEAHLPHGHPRAPGLQHPRGGSHPPLRGLPAVCGERLLSARRPALQRLPEGHPGAAHPAEGAGEGDPREAAEHAGQGLLGRPGHPHREQQRARQGDDHAGAEGRDPGADLRGLRDHGQRQHLPHHAAAEAPQRAGEAAGGAAGQRPPAQRLRVRGRPAAGHARRPALPGLRHQGGHAALHAHLRRLPHRAADLRARRLPDPQGLERDVQHPGHPRHGPGLQGRGRLRPRALQPGAQRGQGRPLPLPALRRRRPHLPGQAPGQALPEGAGGGAGQHEPLRAGQPDIPADHAGPRPAPRGRPQRQVLWPGLQPEQDPHRDRGHAGGHRLTGPGPSPARLSPPGLGGEPVKEGGVTRKPVSVGGDPEARGPRGRREALVALLSSPWAPGRPHTMGPGGSVPPWGAGPGPPSGSSPRPRSPPGPDSLPRVGARRDRWGPACPRQC
ncbi:collagen alpha-1(I) chain isoform X1 [Antechinus flavipes]|uniref:collagen alpha-1(I) chain isoform X1 n=1 Tax=Antechinus flavipes TaxID=38775 RepID=UPI0022355C44|nr:collagen alpha-1(I) chain isoform X1 [Antechinus flavipes]